MDKIILAAKRRDRVGKKVKMVRKEGGLPAVLYGKGTEAFPIILDLKEATKVLTATTSSSLLTIDVDGEEFTTLVRERQRDFIRGNYLHVDFLVVSLTEKVKAKVKISFEGEAPALSVYESILTTGLSQIEVESFPQDLPEKISVDLSTLMEVGDGIYIRDLELPDKVDVMDDENEMVIVVSAQIIVEEEEEEEILEEYDEDGVLIEAEEADEDGESEQVSEESDEPRRPIQR